MKQIRNTVVVDVSGLYWAASRSVTEKVLSRRPGVISVKVNPATQSASISYDSNRTSLAEIALWIEDCGFHCAGQSVPRHMCEPMSEPATKQLLMGAHPSHDDLAVPVETA